MGEVNVGTLIALLRLRDEMSPALEQASRNLSSLGTDMQRVGREMQSAGMTLTAGLTVPLAAVGLGVAKLAIDFESSFAGVRKTVDATEQEFAQLAQGLRDLAKEIPVNVNELNRIAEAAGQLGIKKETILQFTEVMAKLGVTTNLTGEAAATMLARFANVTQMEQTGENFERLGSTIVALGNSLATTEEEIVTMGLRLAGAGTQIGLAQADILGLAGALSSVGIHAEAGGTAFSRVMIKMQDAVKGGGESLQMFSAIAGTDFRKAFEEDAALAINAFIAGLSRAHLAGENLTPILEALELGEIRVSDALRRTGNAYELVSAAVSNARQAWIENTALTEEARKRFETTASQLQVLWQRITDVGMTIGIALLPMIQATIGLFNSFIPMLESAALAFAAMPTGIQAAVVGLGLLLAAVGPILIALGTMVSLAGVAVSGLGTLAGAVRAVAVALGVVGPAATAATSATTAISTAAAAAYANHRNFAAGMTAAGLAAQQASGTFINVAAGMSAAGRAAATTATATTSLTLAQRIAAADAAIMARGYATLTTATTLLGSSQVVMGTRIAAAAIATRAAGVAAGAAALAKGALAAAINLVNGSALVMGVRMAAAAAATAAMNIAAGVGVVAINALSAAYVLLTRVFVPLALFTGLVYALNEVRVAWNNMNAAFENGKSFWEFISQKDDDTFLRRWLGLSDGIQKTSESFKSLSDAMSGVDLQQRVLDLTAYTNQLNASVEGVDRGAFMRVGEAIRQLKDQHAELTPELEAQLVAYVNYGKAALLAGESTKGLTKQLNPLSEEAKKAAEAVQALVNRLGGTDAIRSAQQWAEAVAKIGGVSKISAQDQQAYNDVLGDAIEAIKRMGREVPPAMYAAFEATSKWRDELMALEREMRAVPDSMQGMGGAINDVEIKLLDAALAADRLHLELVQLESSGASQVTGAIGNIGNAAGEAELAILEMRGEIEKLKVREHAEAVQALASAFVNLGGAIGGSTGGLVANIGGMATSLLDFAGASTKFLQGTAAIVQGVANVWQAIGGDQSKGESALSGAMAGLQAGLNPALMLATGGWSAVAGAAGGALAGWLSGQSGPTQEELLKAQEMVREWSQSVSGYFDQVSTAADRLRVGQSEAARTAEVVTRAYTDFGLSARLAEQNLRALSEAQRQGPEAVERVLGIITAQIERHQQVMREWAEGVNTFMDGFTMRVEGIGLLADRIRANDDLLQQGLAGSARSQEELIRLTRDLDHDTRVLQDDFQRLGEYAVIAFSVTLTQTGSLIEAFRQLQGPLNDLISLQEEFGLEGSRSFERLKDISGIIAANQDIFTSIEGLTLMMDGLSQATLLTHEDMQVFGLDAVSLFDQMIARGIDADFAMASMQPTLQMLWEWQQKFGTEINASTQALIDQAVQAGIVGEEQRSVHERMVSAIQLVEAAILRLPEAFASALSSARALGDELERISRTPTSTGVYTGNQAVPRTEHDGGMVYHEGGYIPRAHSGMFLGRRLASDEVPIIAQTGEAVLSRRATAAIGGEGGVNALNGGGAVGAGGMTVQVIFQGGIQVGSSREFEMAVGRAVNRSLQRDGEVWGEHERIVKQMVGP